MYILNRFPMDFSIAHAPRWPRFNRFWASSFSWNLDNWPLAECTHPDEWVATVPLHMVEKGLAQDWIQIRYLANISKNHISLSKSVVDDSNIAITLHDMSRDQEVASFSCYFLAIYNHLGNLLVAISPLQLVLALRALDLVGLYQSPLLFMPYSTSACAKIVCLLWLKATQNELFGLLLLRRTGHLDHHLAHLILGLGEGGNKIC